MTDAGQPDGVEGPVLLDLVRDAGFEIPGRAFGHGDEPLGGVHQLAVQLAVGIAGDAAAIRNGRVGGDFPLLERLRVQDVFVAAPDHDHRVSRRCPVEIPPQGEALLPELSFMPVGVRDHQLARAGDLGALADCPEQLSHGADPGEVHPVTAAGAVEVVVGETGDDRFARHFNDFGVRSDEVPDVRVRTYGQDPTVPDRQGFGHGEVRVHGEDVGIQDDEVGVAAAIRKAGGARAACDDRRNPERPRFRASEPHRAHYAASASSTSAGVLSGERNGLITVTSPSRWPCWRSSVSRTAHSLLCAAATMSASHHESA